MADLAEQVRILREGAGVVRLDREVVLVTGEAAPDYLQGQLSQEVATLEAGHARWSFVLQPQGKVDAWFRITRLDDTTYSIDIDTGWADPLIERLERFRLRTPVSIERSAWQVTAVRGAEAPSPVSQPDPGRGVVVPVDWPGDRGWDLIGDGGLGSDLPECSIEAIEVLRIEAGRPRMGHELDTDTIPAAAGVVAQSVSFTKGCFTGQELVARIDSRGGQAPHRLVGLHLDGASAPERGDSIRVGDDQVGTVTSVAAVSSFGHPIALGYLARRVEVPAEVTVGSAGQPARAIPLPMVDPPRA